MKKIRSYSSIWSVEKVIYAINDMPLPFPITFSQMAWFVACELAMLALGELPPLSMIDGALLKYFGIPVGPHMVYEPKDMGRQEAVQFRKILYGLPASPQTDLCRQDSEIPQGENRTAHYGG